MRNRSKRSKQRDSIQAFLASRHDHPTAETVYLNIREQIPNISLATVYRNLSLLSEQGEIRKISIGQGPDRFDGNTEPHSHFICRECGTIIDLAAEPALPVTDMDGHPFDGKIDEHVTCYYGLCPTCLKKTLPTGNIL
ncbi:hypothetical protein CXIVA_09330 [Clostridium sp. SY8519]|uniref:Fur family transcriptional regulator n=1 Tax=Clostridium sp. (strain SY8519) TaxID=1042156 RepID=UPI00021719BA|nr:transcriptional repressor [Clostridium sp. SY8519]BAK46900.1 hypothetical protein CXIVA_09330 [Clostridium sp. SY8519]